MKSTPHPLHALRRYRKTACAGAFLITLAVGPASAGVDDFTIPPEPMSVGAPVPPNILLLLDDSGSMSVNFMFNPTITSIRTPPDANQRMVTMRTLDYAYPYAGQVTSSYNTLAYDPRVTYRPWKLGDGTYMGEIDPTAAPTSGDFAHPFYGTVNQQDGEQRNWFYVLDPAAVDEPENLTRYTLYKLKTRNDAEICTTAEKDSKGNWLNPDPIGESGQLWPEGTCRRILRFEWVTSDGQVIQRSLDEEWRNYANWYGYHRTRMKAVKAAISHVFSALEGNVRVGYANLNKPAMNLDIPVKSADGLFVGQNRIDWFSRMLAEKSTGLTPLRSALRRAGQYFSRKDADGPWGPEPPERQLACRQNFLMLATDGMWTGGDEGSSGNADGTSGEVMTSPTGAVYQYKPAPPYADEYSETLADAAMLYWKNDLRPDLANTVPTSADNPAFWQHMVTFTISVGLRGALDPVADLPALTSGTKRWPKPYSSDSDNSDDLFHASVNGHGIFANAMNPQAFRRSLEAALGAITERTSSGSSLAADSAKLEAGERSFVASYLPGPWSGDLKAYATTMAGVSSALAWSAAESIPTHDQRRIYTHALPGQAGRRPTKAFPSGDQTKVLTPDIAAWIRGDRSLEGTMLRTRKSPLGDIVHSSPVHVKTAGAEAVFVGANDGMLHVFDAVHGKELLAYVPGLLDMSKLKELSEAKHFRHRYFVDGPVTVARTDRGNGVLAVGVLGRGGRGVYGLSLDLARPEQPPTSWEFTGDIDMGQVLARPQLALARPRSGNGPRTPNKVLVANGINSPSGKAALYVLDATTGGLLRKMAAGDEAGNGLSTPTLLDVDGDGHVDRAYAGDMRGNLWRFDLAGSAGEWSVSKVFTAQDASGNRQPITGGVGVALHPLTHLPWVFFGTGSYVTAADASSVSTQSWYGVEDSGSTVSRDQLLARRIVIAGTAGGTPVRAFEKARPNDMRGKRGWMVDLRTPGVDAEGERMIGESQQIVGGRTLVAASIIPGGGGCGGNGRGYLNAIDPFTGGATSDPFFDVDGDGKFDGQDGVDGLPAGSIDLGLGMISDPGILLGKLLGGGGDAPSSQACVSGASATTGCVAFNTGGSAGRYGRVSWIERSQQ